MKGGRAPRGRARALEPEPDAVAHALAARLEEAAGGGAWAVLLFGSRLAGTAPGPHSAYDLVLVVDAYGPFYQRLHALGLHGRSPRLLTAISGVLAPNILAFDPGLPGGEIGKVMVFTPADLERALSPRAPDHFLRGRLVQRVAVLRARDAGVRARVEEMLEGARRDVLRWAAPWLPARFGAADLARRMLEVSYAAEVRPEAAGRVAAVFEAQRGFLERVFAQVLEEGEREGRVVRVAAAPGERLWTLTHRGGALQRGRWRLYFLRSKGRATARWLKHVVTFDDWLAYLQRKVERRTGITVELTPLERRLPLVFLWPKALRILFALRRGGAAPAAQPPRPPSRSERGSSGR